MAEQNPNPPDPADVPEPEQAPEPTEPEPTEQEQADEEQETADHLADNLAGLGGAAEAALDAPATAEDWEKRFATAEKRFATYSRAVTALWEEDAVHLAPISISPSAPPGFIDVRDAGRVPEEIKAVVMEFFGVPREQDYEPDPAAHTCGTCKGKGRTATGSLVASERSRQCPACRGLGFVDESDTSPNGDVSALFAAASGELDREPVAGGDRDPWGEPRILPNGERNENYGLMPQFKKEHPTYGVTANLGATPAG